MPCSARRGARAGAAAAQSGACLLCDFLDGVASTWAFDNVWGFEGGQIWPSSSSKVPFNSANAGTA